MKRSGTMSNKELRLSESDKELLALIAQAKRKNAHMLEAKKDYDALKKDIAELIGDLEVIYNPAGVEILTYKHGKDTNKFQQAAFKQSNPDLYDSFCEIKPGSRSFLIK